MPKHYTKNTLEGARFMPDKKEIVFKDGQEISLVFGDGPPVKAKWSVLGIVAPRLLLEEKIEIEFVSSEENRSEGNSRSAR